MAVIRHPTSAHAHCTATAAPLSRAAVEGRGSGGAQRLLEHVEPDGAEVERLAVEGLQVERVTLAGCRLVAGLFPEPLADLVRGRLAGPAD